MLLNAAHGYIFNNFDNLFRVIPTNKGKRNDNTFKLATKLFIIYCTNTIIVTIADLQSWKAKLTGVMNTMPCPQGVGMKFVTQTMPCPQGVWDMWNLSLRQCIGSHVESLTSVWYSFSDANQVSSHNTQTVTQAKLQTACTIHVELLVPTIAILRLIAQLTVNTLAHRLM